MLEIRWLLLVNKKYVGNKVVAISEGSLIWLNANTGQTGSLMPLEAQKNAVIKPQFCCLICKSFNIMYKKQRIWTGQ